MQKFSLSFFLPVYAGRGACYNIGMNRLLFAIGGGELRTKSTLPIDRVIASVLRRRAGERRPCALFFGTASHDSLPYFNSFRKIYTSVFDIKVDVALLTKKDVPLARIREKIELADLIYVGGGDTCYLIDVWKSTGILPDILAAYRRGTVLAGLSAGAVCWFERMYTDSFKMNGLCDEYRLYDGLGLLPGLMSPHYEGRRQDFAAAIEASGLSEAYGVDTDAALVFENETPVGMLSAGGGCYKLKRLTEGVSETPIATFFEAESGDQSDALPRMTR